jgi:hypothetical protein
VTDEHLPALFHAADRSSLAAQRRYLGVLGANLAAMIGGGVVGAWSGSSPDVMATLNLVVAAALVFGLILTAFLLQTKPDQQWYGARAIAESVKSIAWRYMAGADPYPRALPDRQADELVLRQIGDILRAPSPGGAALGDGAAGDEITPRMREVRSQELSARTAIYLRDRLQTQRSWYEGKARSNARAATGWLLAVAGAQFLGAAASVAMIRWPQFPFDVGSVLASLAAAAMAWLEARRCQELAAAYGLAAHELGLAEARARHVTGEAELAAFVADAESAISRAHTMWSARRSAVT